MCDYPIFQASSSIRYFYLSNYSSLTKKNIVLNQFFLENAPTTKHSMDLVKSGFCRLYYIQHYGKPLHPLAANPVLACGHAHPQLQYLWGVITPRSLYLRHSAWDWCLPFNFPSHIHKETQSRNKRPRTWDSSWYIFLREILKDLELKTWR